MVENKTVLNQACRKGCLGMNCVYKGWGRNHNRFRPHFGIKQGYRPAKIFANATAPFWAFLEPFRILDDGICACSYDRKIHRNIFVIS